jgi:hypothetical protein
MSDARYSKAQAFRLVFMHEARVLIADRTLPLVLTLFALLLGYATYNGIVETRARDITIASILAKQNERHAANLDQLQRINAGTETPVPSRMRRILPTSGAASADASPTFQPPLWRRWRSASRT